MTTNIEVTQCYVNRLKRFENYSGRGLHISLNQWAIKWCLLSKKIYPCAHADGCFASKHGNEYGMSIYEFSSPLYKVESFFLAYLDYINVVLL
ncbi:hypothetical protein H5410_065019 [Solanum commersonii]|uniref:Uncharacterized protein n=1 Tax=Solanum commersonii TaxID=4109 RepID=A0A9J5VY27_SOLCO|nr:hypothetical protein H5410_065019 [Solanum commersonii]